MAPRRRIRRRRKRHWRLRPGKISRQEPIFRYPELQLSEFAKGKHPFQHLLNNGDRVARFFKNSTNYRVHLVAQNEARVQYVASLVVLLHHGDDASVSSEYWVFSLAAALARNDRELMACLLNLPLVGATEVLKALCVLDIRRRVKVASQISAKAELLVPNISKRKRLKSRPPADVKQWYQVQPSERSANGALIRCIQRWTQTLDKEYLDKALTSKDTKTVWRNIADLCHFNPEEHFPASPTFLRKCFAGTEPDKPAAEGEAKGAAGGAAEKEALNSFNVNGVVAEKDVPLSQIVEERLTLCLTDESKRRIASYTDFEEVIRNYNCLDCGPAEEVVLQRLVREGERLVVDEDGRPKIGSFLKMLCDVYGLTQKEHADMVRFQPLADDAGADADAGAFAPVIEKLTRTPGAKVYQALLKVLMKQLEVYRKEIRDLYPDRPLVFTLDPYITYGYLLDLDMESTLRWISVYVLSMLVDGQIYGPTTNIGLDYSESEFTSVLRDANDLATDPAMILSKIDHLIEVQMVVPYIFFFYGQCFNGFDNDSERSETKVLKALARYAKLINPDVVLVLCAKKLEYIDTRMSDKKIKTCDLGITNGNYGSKIAENIDRVIQNLRCRTIKLQSFEDQVEDVQNRMELVGMTPVFREFAERRYKLRDLDLTVPSLIEVDERADKCDTEEAQGTPETMIIVQDADVESEMETGKPEGDIQ